MFIAIMQHSKRQKLFDEIKDSVQFQLVGIEECLQPNLIHPTFIPHYHLLLEWSYRSGGIVLVMLVLKIIKNCENNQSY